MARKQTRGAQISRVAWAAAAAACLIALPAWAQEAPKGKRAEASAVSVADVDKDIRQTKGALDSIKTELERGRERFRELQSEEGNYLGRLEQIEKNISVSGKYIEGVQGQIDAAEKTLALLGDSLARAEADLKSARERMKRRLREAHKTGEVSRLQMLLSAKSPAEFVHRVRYFQDLNNYDKRLAGMIRENIAAVNGKRAAQEESKLALEKLLGEKRAEQRVLVDEEASRRTVLKDIRTKKEAFAAMVAEFEEAQRELDVIIKVLEDRRKKALEEEERRAKLAKEEEARKAVKPKIAIGFEKIKGKLGWPVRGEVITKFGKVVHPVYKTVIMNNGIDIAAKKGSPVKSVARGSVAHIGWMRGLGRLVIVDHSDGFITVYGNLDEVTVSQDQDVSAGTEIGKVGETGTAAGPKLHFEIRKSAESLNPEEWLEK